MPIATSAIAPMPPTTPPTMAPIGAPLDLLSSPLSPLSLSLPPVVCVGAAELLVEEEEEEEEEEDNAVCVNGLRDLGSVNAKVPPLPVPTEHPKILTVLSFIAKSYTTQFGASLSLNQRNK